MQTDVYVLQYVDNHFIFESYRLVYVEPIFPIKYND